MSGGMDGPRGVAANRVPEKKGTRAGLLAVTVLTAALALPAFGVRDFRRDLGLRHR